MKHQLSDSDGERLVARLRESLRTTEDLPPGTVARLAAGVARARRRERAGWEARLVVACLVFLLAGSSAATPVLALVVLASLYAWLLPLRAEGAASPPA